MLSSFFESIEALEDEVGELNVGLVIRLGDESDGFHVDFAFTLYNSAIYVAFVFKI